MCIRDSNKGVIAECELGRYKSVTNIDVMCIPYGYAICVGANGPENCEIIWCNYTREIYGEEAVAKLYVYAKTTISLPPKEIFLMPYTLTQKIFILTSDGKIFFADIPLKSVEYFYVVNYEDKTKVRKITDAEHLVYVGSLKGAKHSVQIGPAEAYGLYYNSVKKKLVIFRCHPDYWDYPPKENYPLEKNYMWMIIVGVAVVSVTVVVVFIAIKKRRG